MKTLTDIIINDSENQLNSGAEKAQVEEAESKLMLHFADEYKEYLLKCGFSCIKGHELTGICPSKRLSVIETTMRQKLQNDFVPKDWYVVEELNIDGVVVWQDGNGFVYQTACGRTMGRIAGSLAEFVCL